MKLLLTALLGCLACVFVVPANGDDMLKWCVTSDAELDKCMNLKNRHPNFSCVQRNSVLHCIEAIKRRAADLVAADGGEVFTAGKCGLVPVLAEQYDEKLCGTTGNTAFSYYAVAVVKKDSQVTWQNLQGKKSCHTGFGRTAGWNIPMSHIYNQTNDCDFTKFFSSGCAPGADPSSSFCTRCAGSGAAKCNANDDEPYFGYAGAFKCLVEDSGDVAFVKHTTVPENTDGNGADCTRTLSSADFELICPGSPNPVPITDFVSCNLARVPAHAVISLPENRAKIVRIFQDLQDKFGPNGSDTTFRIFESDGGRNLLFKDSTKCLQEVQTDNYESFLGNEYINAVRSLRQCSANTPGLEKCCIANNCQTSTSAACGNCSA